MGILDPLKRVSLGSDNRAFLQQINDVTHSLRHNLGGVQVEGGKIQGSAAHGAYELPPTDETVTWSNVKARNGSLSFTNEEGRLFIIADNHAQNQLAKVTMMAKDGREVTGRATIDMKGGIPKLTDPTGEFAASPELMDKTLIPFIQVIQKRAHELHQGPQKNIPEQIIPSEVSDPARPEISNISSEPEKHVGVVPDISQSFEH